MIFFKNNWINFHFNLDPSQKQRQSKWDVFCYSTSLTNFKFGSFQEEMEKTCEEIFISTQRLGTKLGLFLSGGLDSEIIARTLLKMGIPFDSYFIVFHNQLNQHERDIVDTFQNQTGHRVNYIDVDIEKWLQSANHLEYYAKTYRTFDMATPLQMWARTKISKGHSMISGLFEPHLHRVVAGESCQLEWFHAVDESSVCSRMKFIEKNFYSDFPFFYLYRPQLYAAYCFDPHVQSMLSNPYKLSLVSTKKIMMKHYFPEMEERPKYTGFENVKELCGNVMKNITHEFVDGQLRIPHRDFERLFTHAS